eukprot:TRINITY_DN3595_c0_g2_i4.p1 TRINITY_DN3595_c0_g2~~TRINITY_DN3595_c0_g2_i4.p1  ORF type:complete len:874 (+),score=323.80 TRINITY_DN3595_c0_g2_i4:92-2713(+)
MDMDPEDLDDMEFDELPEFANEENKALSAEVQSLEKELEKASEDHEENKDRLKILIDHLKNVKNEHGHTAQLLEHKEKEIETEIHLRQLAEREIGRLRAEMKKFDNLAAEYQDKVNNVQNKIFRGNEQMDNFKVQLNWDQEALENWVLTSKQKEEDNVALERYAKADAMKINDKALQIERLTLANNEKKKLLDEEVTETQAAQIELDKTAEQFRALHEERQHLIKQWEDALAAMKRRDESITDASERFQEMKMHVDQSNKEIAQKAKFLEGEQQNNREKDAQISHTERLIQKTRLEHNQEEQDLALFQDEVDVVANTLIKCATELSNKRNELVNAEEGLQDKQKRLARTHRELAKVKSILEDEVGTARTLEERAKMEEEYRLSQESRLSLIDKELKEVKEAMFKQSQELFNLRKSEADMIADISGSQNRDRMLKSRISQLDKESQKQNQLLYNVDFQLQQLERKVARAGGERSLEEKELLEKRIQQLAIELDDVTKEQKLLHGQVKTIEVGLKLANRKHNDLQNEHTSLTDKVNELRLENSSSQTALKSKTKEVHTTMVQHDVLKLDLANLTKTLRELADHVVAAENHRQQVKLSMESKEREIALHKEVLRMEVRTMQEQKHEFVTTLNEKKTMVKKLDARLSAISSTMGTSEDGEPVSQSYFLIKAAQERETLQRDGDLLDLKLKKTEKEIMSLNQLLRSLHVKNTAFKTSFSKADPKGKDAQNKNAMETKTRQLGNQLKRKEQALKNLEEDVAVVEQRLEISREEMDRYREMYESLEEQNKRVDEEVEEQSERLDKTSDAVKTAAVELRTMRGLGDGVTPEEMEIELDNTKHKNTVLMEQLMHALQNAPENARPVIEDYIQQAGLVVPGLA